MKRIIKSDEPRFFIDWKTENSPRTWEDLQNPEKNRLRKILVEDQGFICCYCNREIVNDHTTSIEHLLPQDRDKFPEKRFEFTNLLAACDGGTRDQPRRMTHCDARKGNKSLPITPLDDDCESRFRFIANGEIIADGNDSNALQTIEILGLNIPKLRSNRRKAIEPYLDLLDSEIETADEIYREIEFLNQKVDGKYAPFCTAIINILENLLS